MLIEEERSKVKALGRWQTHAAESNQCGMTKAEEKYRGKRAEVCTCACVNCADECS